MHEMIAASDGSSGADVRVLPARGAADHIEALAAILADCVAGGASVGFMLPFTLDDARAWWQTRLAGLARGDTLLFGGFVDGELLGTAQLGLDRPSNQLHRADVRKVLVHRKARRCGLAGGLMTALEAEARRRGLLLLTLDTATGSAAERLYERLGYTRAGMIPRYALWPDGRFCDTTLFWKAI
jgi:GNAT superfamily N-acetyltransferase